MVFRVGVKRNPTLAVVGDIDKMDRDTLRDLASEYLESIYFEPARVIKREGYTIIILEPASYPLPP